MTKLAIFASGSGTNAEAIVRATQQGDLDAEVAVIITDKPKAKVIDRATMYHIPYVIADPKQFESKADFEKHLILELRKKDVELVVLAGYMRLVGTTLLSAYEGRIVNIHPSLLPSFPGLDAIGQAFNAKVKITGVTIHYVDAGMDTGEIITQEPVRIEENDTVDSLQKKIQNVEHKLYPKTIQMIIDRAKEVG
ncbi:phosphoribosylglycinamide formyltransferase [Halalkalibacter wakoensis JCM 9140]|uniref:Phosphoribosylglycinamide formyltransferase n=1 Tax=Halalkalibacter wakoensis JCM 9140 TaxID=1236970 RepID=W4Q6G8_9BACI|nr:phosphoribosylglycinamide formyltransferase [Halalkalibacter wakoensis]GAE27550.1 phosphoribosylglycinamide formyltransferase [Halalkalibacter wakoensis JCM 9140]